MAATAAETINYRLADDIPELAIGRQAIRLDTLNILETRRQEMLEHGESQTQLPLQIDALSTAHRVIEAEKQFGSCSVQHLELLEGLRLDCGRLVAEWYRKKRPEYFPPVRHKFDEQTEEFFSHGLSISQMTANAIRPIKDNAEEEARRVNERVEDATPKLVRKLGSLALQGQAIRTISECTDKAIADYAYDQKHKLSHRGYDGYVPEIEKVMIRDIRLDEHGYDRFEEQIGLPGLYINHYVIQKALERRGAAVGQMGKTELHGSQILVNDDLMDFIKLLDEVASEEWCIEVFMGEKLEPGQARDYANFRQEALKRQSDLKDVALTVTNFVLDLASDKVDGHLAPAMVEDFVKKLLLDLAKKDFYVAEQMFDKDTAKGLQQVAYLESRGQYEQALKLMQKVEAEAPGGGFCGGSACGLERVNLNSKEGKELAEKLDAKPGDTIVKDKVRKCKCGANSIVYAYNSTKVNKYCTSCKATESKITQPAA